MGYNLCNRDNISSHNNILEGFRGCITLNFE